MNKHARQRAFVMLLIVSFLFGGMSSVQSSTVYQNASEWAKPELEAAAQNGLIPQRLLGQDMKRLATLFGRTLAKAYPGEDRTIPGTPVFEDQALINTWALEHVLYMNRIGVIKGANNRFMPRPVTPEQTASGYGTTSREAAVAISVRSHVQLSGSQTQPGMPGTPSGTPVPTGSPVPAVSPTPFPGLMPGIESVSLVNQISFNVVADNGMPAVKLKDNRIYPLLPLEIRPPMVVIMPADMYPTPLDVSQFQIVPPPATVDHRGVQTSIKDQAGRNTCVSFAVVAAMEAAYIRKDPVRYKAIDLSEQFANYIQKLVRLVDPPRPEAYLRENSLGRWGWGGVLYSTTLFGTQYGVPEESLLPYITGGAYENTNQYGDDPGSIPTTTARPSEESMM